MLEPAAASCGEIIIINKNFDPAAAAYVYIPVLHARMPACPHARPHVHAHFHTRTRIQARVRIHAYTRQSEPFKHSL